MPVSTATTQQARLIPGTCDGKYVLTDLPTGSEVLPGAVAGVGDGAETPAVCCVPPVCACGPPGGLCVAATVWPRLTDQPRRDG